MKLTPATRVAFFCSGSGAALAIAWLLDGSPLSLAIIFTLSMGGLWWDHRVRESHSR
jgi:hypothetical protein